MKLRFLCLGAVLGCSSADSDAPPAGRHDGYETAELDVSDFGDDPEVRGRILYMPFGEAAERLGSLPFEGRSPARMAPETRV